MVLNNQKLPKILETLLTFKNDKSDFTENIFDWTINTSALISNLNLIICVLNIIHYETEAALKFYPRVYCFKFDHKCLKIRKHIVSDICLWEPKLGSLSTQRAIYEFVAVKSIRRYKKIIEKYDWLRYFTGREAKFKRKAMKNYFNLISVTVNELGFLLSVGFFNFCYRMEMTLHCTRPHWQTAFQARNFDSKTTFQIKNFRWTGQAAVQKNPNFKFSSKCCSIIALGSLINFHQVRVKNRTLPNKIKL